MRVELRAKGRERESTEYVEEEERFSFHDIPLARRTKWYSIFLRSTHVRVHIIDYETKIQIISPTFKTTAFELKRSISYNMLGVRTV